MRPPRVALVYCALLVACSPPAAVPQGALSSPAARSEIPAGASYWVYVGAESADLIHRVRFAADGITLEKSTPVGSMVVDTDGPHGLQISPDERFLYMTTGHGLPDGKFWKIELGPDTVAGGPLDLGRFPATLDVTPDGLFAFVVNFNLYGDHVASSVSIVFTEDMVEVAQVETCTMPHGSRVSPDGMRHYSACMMDDEIVEIDTRSFEVSRRFSVATGREGPIRSPHVTQHADSGAHGDHGSVEPSPSCSPTWVQPAPTGDRVYVACNRSDELLEIDAADWRLLRRFATGRGPYNIDITSDGRLLVVTLKQGNAVQVFDLDSGESAGVIETSTSVVHGVTISPDDRFAFVSVEGVGSEPGKVDVLDLRTLRRVADVDVGMQASGIAFWKLEAGDRDDAY